MARPKIEPYSDEDLTPEQLTRAQHLIDALHNYECVDEAVKLAKQAASLLRRGGFDDAAIAALLPLSTREHASVRIRNAALVSLLDVGADKRFVIYVALKAGMISPADPGRVLRNFNERINETRAQLENANLRAIDVAGPVWENVRAYKFVENLETRWRTEGNGGSFGEWIEKNLPSDQNG